MAALAELGMTDRTLVAIVSDHGFQESKQAVRLNTLLVAAGLLTLDDKGKVTGVVYVDKAGQEQRQKARIVCVAGNSIESPRLLLNSASSPCPQGLGNSSGQGGQNSTKTTTPAAAAAAHALFRGRQPHRDTSWPGGDRVALRR